MLKKVHHSTQLRKRSPQFTLFLTCSNFQLMSTCSLWHKKLTAKLLPFLYVAAGVLHKRSFAISGMCSRKYTSLTEQKTT